MGKVKVLFVSINDWSNSHYKNYEALNRHSKKYEAEYFCAKPHTFNYYRGENIIYDSDGYPNFDVIARLRTAAKEATILHTKENEGLIQAIDTVNFMSIPGPKLNTFGGSVYRAHHEKIDEANKNYINKSLATTPDLIFSKETSLLPFAVDEQKYLPGHKSQDCIVIGHSPTNTAKKGTTEIVEVFKSIQSRHSNVFFNIQQGIPHSYAMEFKRLNHIFIDQISSHGSYGNSAVEALALGSYVLSSSKFGAKIADVSAETLEAVLEDLIANPAKLQELQAEQYKFFLETHSYPIICSKLENYYDEALDAYSKSSSGSNTISTG